MATVVYAATAGLAAAVASLVFRAVAMLAWATEQAAASAMAAAGSAEADTVEEAVMVAEGTGRSLAGSGA